MAKNKPLNQAPKNLFRNYYMLIAAVSMLVYVNTLNHGFVLDDTAVIENNRFVKAGISGIPDIMSTFYWEGYWNSNAGLYRPLSLVTFAIEYQISPANPSIHHLFNILYYVLLCCLLFEFLCNVFKKINPQFFLFAVLLFVVHPIHTEVVANIKSRDEILSLLFFLLCCRALYRKSENSLKSIVLSSLFFLLALLSKEGAIAFLPIIFLIDYWREKNIGVIVRQRILLLSSSVLWFVWHQYIILHSASPKINYTYSDNSLLASSSFLEQKATAFGMFTRYIIKAFFPYELSYDYSFNQIPIINFVSILALAGVVIFIGLIYFAYKNVKSNNLIAFSITIMLLPLLLTGNLFFNIGATMADRFLFVPTLGSCILICLLVFKLFKTDPFIKGSNASMRYTFIVLLLLFSVRTFTRNKDWKDNNSLFQADVKTVPNSARARYNNAVVLQMLNEKADLSSCRKEYEACLKIDPSFQDALINLGVIYTKQKEFALAIALYHKALAQDKNNAGLLGNMGEAFYKSGKADSSIYYLKKAHLAGNTTTGSYNILGTALFSKQAYNEAREVFEKGIKNDTTNWELYLNYGNVLAVTNKFQEALLSFKQSYRINSSNAKTAYFIALTYRQLGDTLNANQYYMEYQKLNK